MKRILLCVFLAAAGALPIVAQPSAPAARPAPAPGLEYSASITPELLREHLTILASDAFEGRETGHPGQVKAAQYLTQQFEQLGLRGPVSGGSSPFQQSFGILGTTPTGAGTVRVGSTTFVDGQDFVFFGASTFPESAAPADPVFRGFGIETATYNDYAGQPDVRGRDVIVLQGEPNNGLGRYLFSGSKQESEWSSVFRKAALARDKGARSLTVVTYATPKEFARLAGPVQVDSPEPTYFLASPVLQPEEKELQVQVPPAYITTIITNGPLGAALLGTTVPLLWGYDAESYKLKQPPARLQPVPFTIHLPQKREALTSSNVLGFLEGSDKKDEVLVISAHYDHVGVQHDTIYNGADDDGSGTSAVLALARAFSQAKAAGHGPRRSILFLLNSGEEKGLLGSEYYTGHPVFPLAQTIADLNIDMIGRTDKAHQGKPGYLYLIGSNRLSTELHTLSEEANARTTHLRLDYKYNDPKDPEQLYYRSDHYNFARHGIPIIFYTSGLHQDYHKATDDVDRIEFKKLAERAKLVFFTAWELANREKRLSVNATRP
ncbi:M28 family peptidase [Hymenobacter cellulosilyticus]|uniref:M28 family peptidase n=1 Tax=Hymenobacter cellulosilyticus TaxID=2932248 RepID=A0A8T9Q833_9BACT|nr:M28 family peptidase [Hymenobacter cellulosilyticus]UOQ73726.1 M28 family peptidase [Hymenobacter cellulosilyticus]